MLIEKSMNKVFVQILGGKLSGPLSDLQKSPAIEVENNGELRRVEN